MKVSSRAYYNSQEVGLGLGLADLNIDVDIFIASQNAEVCISKINSNRQGVVRVIELPYIRIPEIDHALYPKLKSFLKKGAYSLVQVNEENDLTSFFVARWCSNNKIPVIVYQGMYRPISGRIRAAFQSLYNKTLRLWMRNYLSLCAAKTTHAEKYLRCSGYNNTLVIPVGLDLHPFAVSDPVDWYDKLNISKNKKIILYVGVLENRRNIHFILDLAKVFMARDVVFVIAGDGVIEGELSERIDKEDIRNTRLIGKIAQSNLPSLYSQSAVFLLPSDYEIYGMVVLEAMYFGAPVISTKTAGPVDIIEHGVNGFLVDLDKDGWVKSIDACISKHDLLDQMSLSAKNKIESHLTWSKVAHLYRSKIIDKLCT